MVSSAKPAEMHDLLTEFNIFARDFFLLTKYSKFHEENEKKNEKMNKNGTRVLKTRSAARSNAKTQKIVDCTFSLALPFLGHLATCRYQNVNTIRGRVNVWVYLSAIPVTGQKSRTLFNNV